MANGKPGEIRFVSDVMLGGLAQYILLSGHDCLYDDTFDDPELLKIIHDQNRILLSRDRRLIDRSPAEKALYIDSTNPPEQFRSVVKQFGLEITEDTIFTRCPDCNTDTEPVSASKIEDMIPDETRQWIDEYFRCPSCGKIYWKGTHYEAIREKFARWNVLAEDKEDYS